MIAFRHKQPVMDVKFKNCRSLKFWRYVLVDHEASGESCFRGIGWFIKAEAARQVQNTIDLDLANSMIDTSDLVFNTQPGIQAEI